MHCFLSPTSEKKSQYSENCTLHHGEVWFSFPPPPLILLSLSSHFLSTIVSACLAALMLLNENLNKIIFLRLPLKKLIESLKVAFIYWFTAYMILCRIYSLLKRLLSPSHLHTNKTIILDIIIGYRWCRRHHWINSKSPLKRGKGKLCVCVCNVSRYLYIKQSASLIFKTS